MPTAYIGQYIGGNSLEIFRDVWTYATSQTGSSTQIVVTSVVSSGILTTTINGSGFTFNASGQVTGGTVSDIHVDYDTGSFSSRIVDFQSSDAGGLNADIVTVFSAMSALAGGDPKPYLSILSNYDITFDASTVTYAGGVEFISGGGDDILYGSSGDDLFYGGDGDDIFVTSDGEDHYDGGDGIDTLDNHSNPDTFGGSNTYFHLGYGHGGFGDRNTFVNVERVWGTPDVTFDDYVVAPGDENQIAVATGFEGDDDFMGNKGKLIIDYSLETGGGGIFAQWKDSVFGGFVTDTYGDSDSLETWDIDGVRYQVFGIVGTDHDDTFIGIVGTQLMSGLGGSDELNGNDGDDILIGGADDDILNGGSGFDTAIFSGNRSAYTIDYGAGTISGPDGTDTFSGIERFVFDDVVLTLNDPVGFRDNATADILSQNTTSGGLQFREGDGSGGFNYVGFAGGQSFEAIGDFNGDGFEDILLRYGSGYSHMLAANGDGTFTDSGVTSLANQSVLGVGDFDGDGQDDLLLKYGGGWAHYIKGADQSQNVGVDQMATQTLLGIGDFDGDGRDDLLLRYSGGWMRWLGGADKTQDHGIGPIGTREIVGIGDFDGDGKDDVLTKFGTGFGQYLSGADPNAAVGIGSLSGQEVIGVGDFNDDGLDDILLQFASGWTHYYGGGSALADEGLGNFSAYTILGVADYDGDGRDDILYQNPASSGVFVASGGELSASSFVANYDGFDILSGDMGTSTGDDMLIA
jgi:hypothetical protein